MEAQNERLRLETQAKISEAQTPLMLALAAQLNKQENSKK